MMKRRMMFLFPLALCLSVFVFIGAVEAEEADARYSLSMTMPENSTRIEISHSAAWDLSEITSGTAKMENLAPGDTITVAVNPRDNYLVGSMYFTYTRKVANMNLTVPMEISFTTNPEGIVRGSFTMPAADVVVHASLDTPGSLGYIPYISYDSTGKRLPEKTSPKCAEINYSDDNWLDLNDEKGGWYMVKEETDLYSYTTIRVTGDVHLILCDGASLRVRNGIYIRKGSSLSIYGQSKGSGKLTCTTRSGPGIGGMANTVGGSLYVHGGVITAVGGTNAAGIGGGNHESGYQNIVIYGGEVAAMGGSSGAGIGSGQQNTELGTIMIYGGKVDASSKKNAAAIGGGEDRSGGAIRIYGGNITAKAGNYGAGIGGGHGGSGGDILITGGDITAEGGYGGAGIGGGCEDDGGGDSGTILIKGGTISAKGGGNSAGIGGGQGGTNNNITINGGTVTAITRQYRDDQIDDNGAGIGAGGGCRQTGVITINGGTVTAVAVAGAGIGGSDCNRGGTININGGQVLAVSKTGAGIGGGDNAGNGTVNITNGLVYAVSTEKGAGIGGGNDGHGGSVYISGGEVLAFGGYYNNKGISNIHWRRYSMPMPGIPFEYSAGFYEMENFLANVIGHLLTSGEYGGAGRDRRRR